MIKKLLNLFIALVCINTSIKAQCFSTTAYGNATINACPNGSVSIASCTYKGEYNTLTFNMTGVFLFNATSSSTTTSYFTLTDASNTPIAFGNAPLQATITSTGIYRLHLSTPTCVNESSCHVTSYACVLPLCTGVPAAGTLSNTSYSICPNTNISFSVSGATQASGITYQWQESTSASGPFTNVTTGSGGTTTAYTTASLTTNMYYQMVTTCTASAQSATTSVISVAINPPTLCYCNIGLGGSSCSDFISNVTIFGTSLNNTSACNSGTNGTYTQFAPGANTTATLTSGATYSISVTTNDDNIESMWIDYNKNGQFETTEHYQICTSSTASTATGYNFTVPGSASIGQTGMRIRSRLNGNTNGASDACSNFGSGETEDYIITIVAGTNCSGTPNAGVTPNSIGICPNNTVNITSIGASSGVGITYQWQQSTSITGPFSNVTAGTGSNTISYSTGTLSSNMYYQLVTTCTASALSATTAITSVTMNPANQCFCQTVYSSGCSGDQVDTVIVGTLANYTSGCPAAPYNTFFNSLPIPNYIQGTNVSAKFSCGNGGTHWINVWIDFNDNGIFDATESVLTNFNIASGVVPAQSTVVAIPANAATGNHRMRVVSSWGSSAPSSPNACGPFSWGEAEDYIVNIDLSTSVKNQEMNTNFSLYPNPANETVCIYSESIVSDTKIHIYNTVGDLVAESELNGSKIDINTSQFAAGIYTVKLTKGNNSISKKLVIYK